MKKVFAYIDGFNIYHRINDYLKFTKNKGKPECLKWLNYWSLANSLTVKGEDSLEKVILFTAVSEDFGEESKNRHLKYLDALRANNIEIVFGKFKKKQRKCKVKLCSYPNKDYLDREEKQTDVNIAVHSVKSCLKNEFDKLILFSADTDLIPAIKIIIEEKKEVVPVRLMNIRKDKEGKDLVYWDYNSEEIPKACSREFVNLKWKTLKKHLLPNKIVHENRLITIPEEYKSIQ